MPLHTRGAAAARSVRATIEPALCWQRSRRRIAEHIPDDRARSRPRMPADHVEDDRITLRLTDLARENGFKVVAIATPTRGARA